jgi:predicted GH43/DUF377 family glycosyl hydrolase
MSVGITVLRALEVVVRRKSKTDLVGTNSITTCSKNLKQESASVFNGAAILISSVIDVIMEELLKEITIGT